MFFVYHGSFSVIEQRYLKNEDERKKAVRYFNLRDKIK